MAYLIFAGLIGGLLLFAAVTLPFFLLVLWLGERSLGSLPVGRLPKFFAIVLKNLRRRLLGTSLTYLAVFVQVVIIVAVWSILNFLGKITAEKDKDLKAIVTEKFQLPSQMPFSYAESLSREALSLPPGQRPVEGDLMSWGFYGGTLDLEKRTRENLLFFFALEPHTLGTMMDDLEFRQLSVADAAELRANIAKMEKNPRCCLIGKERLQALNKKVGERIKVFSINYKDIDLEFEIVGTFPDSAPRYHQSAAMNRDYLNRALDDYERKKGKKHDLADKSLNLFWMRLPTTESFEMVADRIAAPGKFSNPSVKCETASSGIASWLDAYKDLVWAMKWLISPAVLIVMSLVVATVVTIGVLQRIKEMAVLKVLGYRPTQILLMVIAEALIVGTLSGLLSAGLSALLINGVMGGFKFPIAFFPAFKIPVEWGTPWWDPMSYLQLSWRNPLLNNAVVWGFGIGLMTSLLGSLIPAWFARNIKVSEVFSKVA